MSKYQTKSQRRASQARHRADGGQQESPRFQPLSLYRALHNLLNAVIAWRKAAKP